MKRACSQCSSSSLPHFPPFLSFSCVCVRARMRVHLLWWRSENRACESQFSSSTVWDLKTKLGTSGLVASTLPTELSWEPCFSSLERILILLPLPPVCSPIYSFCLALWWSRPHFSEAARRDSTSSPEQPELRCDSQNCGSCHVTMKEVSLKIFILRARETR